MAFWLNVLSLLRQRRIALSAAGLAVLLSGAALLLVPVTYTSTSTVVLTTSPTNQYAVAGDPNQLPTINPLLNFNEGLTTALAILVQAMNAPTVLDQLAGGDDSTSIRITDIGDADFLGSKGPFLFLTGTSDAADKARDAVVRAEQRAQQELLDRQRAFHAPESQLISTVVVVPASEPAASWRNRWLAVGAAVLLALAGTLATAYVRQQRRPLGASGNGSVTTLPDWPGLSALLARRWPSSPVVGEGARPSPVVATEVEVVPSAEADPALDPGVVPPAADVVSAAEEEVVDSADPGSVPSAEADSGPAPEPAAVPSSETLVDAVPGAEVVPSSGVDPASDAEVAPSSDADAAPGTVAASSSDTGADTDGDGDGDGAPVAPEPASAAEGEAPGVEALPEAERPKDGGGRRRGFPIKNGRRRPRLTTR